MGRRANVLSCAGSPLGDRPSMRVGWNRHRSGRVLPGSMGNEEPREREIAAYVTGELNSRRRRRFEAHLLQCETCWREVRLAREGRRVAESLRELAPPQLREDVRAAVGLSSFSRPSVRAAAFVAVGLALILV